MPLKLTRIFKSQVCNHGLWLLLVTAFMSVDSAEQEATGGLTDLVVVMYGGRVWVEDEKKRSK